MILRKLAEAIRGQNWFTVVLEILIVVIGIFIGLQVDDWNEARLNDARSRLFTERLIADLREEAYIHAYMLAYNEDVLQSAEAALRTLTAHTDANTDADTDADPDADPDADTDANNEAFLINAFRASQFTWWPRSQSTLEELISTGQLGLIRDDQLRSVALAIYRSPILPNIEREGSESPYRKMFRSLIPMDVHRSIVAHCGDISVELGDYEALGTIMSFECDPGLSRSEMEQAAAALKAEPELVSALRLRVATLDSQLRQLRRGDDIADLKDYLDTRGE